MPRYRRIELTLRSGLEGALWFGTRAAFFTDDDRVLGVGRVGRRMTRLVTHVRMWRSG